MCTELDSHCIQTLVNMKPSDMIHSKLAGLNFKSSNLLFMPFPLFGSPTLELGNRASTLRSKQQNSTPTWGSHIPELRPEALIIGVALSPTLPRQPINLVRPSPDTLLRLQLQIEFHRFLEAFASRLATLAGSSAAAEYN